MESSIAVITIPLTEWTDLKTQMQDIAKSLLEIKGKEKSEFLAPKEVCELLRISRNTYRNYIDTGLLIPIKMNSKKYGRTLIRRVDIDYFLQSRMSS
jgi:hypothetical protein